MSLTSERRHSRNIFKHPGFQFGFLGLVVCALLHTFLPLLAEGNLWGVILARLIQVLLYFLLAGAAAEKMHRQQDRELEHNRGVGGAGLGAAMITSILTWLFIFGRDIVVDAAGWADVFVEPVSLYCMVILDIMLAMAIGSWRGRRVAKKYDFNSD